MLSFLLIRLGFRVCCSLTGAYNPKKTFPTCSFRVKLNSMKSQFLRVGGWATCYLSANVGDRHGLRFVTCFISWISCRCLVKLFLQTRRLRSKGAVSWLRKIFVDWERNRHSCKPRSSGEPSPRGWESAVHKTSLSQRRKSSLSIEHQTTF